MNSLRLSGSACEETCSALTVVPADHEHVHARVDDGLGELAGALWRQRPGHGDTGVADLAEPLGDQLVTDRLGVHLLEPGGGLLTSEPRDLGQHRGRVLVAGPEPLEVEHAQAAETAQRDRLRRRHHRVHRRGQDGQLEPVGVDLPVDADLLGVAGAPRRHDRHVVEGVRAARPLGPADLDLGHAFAGPRGVVRRRSEAGEVKNVVGCSRASVSHRAPPGQEMRDTASAMLELPNTSPRCSDRSRTSTCSARPTRGWCRPTGSRRPSRS